MSTLLEFSMFPTDKGSSVSEYVSKIIKLISEKDFSYKLTAMGTIIETDELKDALQIVNESYKILEPYSDRVYASLKLDIQKSKNNRIESKIKSVTDKIGKVIN